MISSSPEPEATEVLQLLAQAEHSTLTAAQAARLQELVLLSSAARRRYVRYLRLCGQLEWELAIPVEAKLQPESWLNAAPKSDAAAAAPGLISPGPPLGNWRRLIGVVSRPPTFGVLVATCVMVVVLAFSASWQLPIARQQSSPSSHRVAPTAVVARITGSHDCRWLRKMDERGKIHAGVTLALAQGLVELTYGSGVKATLEGPCKLRVECEGGRLSFGRLVAEVPPQGRGFTIETPAGKVIDQGTQFGVEVLRSGMTDVVVFEGRVRVEPQLALADVDAEDLHQGEALRLASPKQLPVKLPMSALAGRFRRSLTPALAAQAPKASPVESELSELACLDDLAFWLTADFGVTAESDDRVSEWQSRTPAVEGAFRAWQDQQALQPKRVPDAIAGRPALRFDGQTRMQLPHPEELGLVGSDYEMFIVAQSRSPKPQFLIGGGFEGLEIHLNGTRESLGARFIPQAPFRFDQSSDAGQSGDFTDGGPHLFNVWLDPRHDYRGFFRIDGRTISDATRNDSRTQDRTPLRLGMRNDGNHGLEGFIAEVLIFQRALTPAERRQVEQALATSYGLVLAAEERD